MQGQRTNWRWSGRDLQNPTRQSKSVFQEIAINNNFVRSIFRILPVDLSDPSATREATEKAKALFGGIDILINNAGTTCNSQKLFSTLNLPLVGVSTRSLFIDMQEPTHRRLMEVDLFAPWILTHDVLPGMN